MRSSRSAGHLASSVSSKIPCSPRQRIRRHALDAAARSALEPLEQRRFLSVAINGSVTLDESNGLQSSGVAVSGEDNNDSDVTLSTLQSQAGTFYNRLFGSSPGLGLSTSFPSSVGVAKSGDTFISVSVSGTVTSLGFSKADGSALPTSGVGVASGLNAVNGGAISLFADSTLGNRMVVGVDTNSDVVLAMFLDPNSSLTSARVWEVQFEPLQNPDAANFDDPVTVSGLGVAAGSSTEFNFSALPSGQNLFGTVGSTTTGLVVIGKTPVLNADGTFTNASNTINTSQGGGPTTIGINNQMFDAGEGAFFTFVKNPVANFLAGAPNGLDQNEADDADNIQYTGGTLEATGGFVRISQIQGNSTATMEIKLFNVNGSPQGQTFAKTALGTGPTVAVTSIKVFNASGQQVVNPQVTITNGVARIAGLDANFKVAWEGAGLHDQVLINAIAGKFDIGGFGVDQPATDKTPLSGLRYEDDGPSISGAGTELAPVTVDESDLATNSTIDASQSASFVSAFGKDGSGTTSISYALKVTAGDSGLVDTASGQKVILSLAGGQIQGRTESSNVLVFTVSIDASTGVVTLDQKRAIVHPDANDSNESKTLVAKYQVEATGTVTDGDGDNTNLKVSDNGNLVFKDDGPSITATVTGAPTLTVDETNLANNANGAFAAQFSPTFGADGQGATPVSYALSTPGGASGLVDTASGQSVVLSLVSGKIEGRTATGNDLVFTVSVDSSGNVNLDQVRSVVHPNTSDPNDSKTLGSAGLVVLTATANDGDADHASAPLNIGQQLVFKDDGPAIGPIANSIVDFITGASVTKTLNGVVGADPNSAAYTIDSFTQSVTVNGVLVKGVLSVNQQVVTYYADTNNNTVFGDAGDTAFYRLTLNQSGAGTYTFEVLATPPPTELSFNFNDLPSGQNLFGMLGDPTTGLIVFGKTPALNPDGTFTNASNTINTSQGGGGTTIGVNNQMFDQGEGAYFTFVKNPDTTVLGPALDSNEADDADNMKYAGGTLEVDNGFLKIVQTQGNAPGSLTLTAFDLAGSPQGRDLITARGTGTQVKFTEVKVTSLNGTVRNISIAVGGQLSVNVTGLVAGDKVSWKTAVPHDQIFVSATGGKFDIGGFGTTQAQPTPDQKFDFVARVTDGDGDFATSAFSIGVDGTGIFDDGMVNGVVI